MQAQVKKLEKSQAELTIEVSQEELKPFLEQAAVRLSRRTKIAGFRPGKAPYHLVKQQLGEMAAYEEALEQAVSFSFAKTIKEKKIETVSNPKIEIIKLAPGNPLLYKVTVSLMPRVFLGDYKSIKVKRHKKDVTDKEVDQALGQLSKMQTKEVLADHAVEKNSKAVIDIEIFRDRVPIEGGRSKGQAVYLEEDYFIPGFNEKLIGQKRGEIRKFTLKFPPKHYQKSLAGKEVQFKVTVKEIYDLEPPEINDAFAISLGQQSLADLKNILKDNLQKENQSQEEQRVEKAMLEKIVEQSRFGELPVVLLESETQKMIAELKESLAHQGAEFDDYLANILKKKPEELRQEFLPQAEERVKTALVVRSVAERENIRPDEEEVNKEREKILKAYEGNEQIQKQIKSEQGREYLNNLVRNRKIIEMLKREIVN